MLVHEITRTALEGLLIEGNLRPYSTLDELDKFELRDDVRWLVVTGSVEFPAFHGCTYSDVEVYCCSNNEEFAVWLAERDAAWYLEHPEICVREFEVWHVVDDDAAVGAFRMDRAVSDAQPLHDELNRKPYHLLINFPETITHNGEHLVRCGDTWMDEIDSISMYSNALAHSAASLLDLEVCY